VQLCLDSRISQTKLMKVEVSVCHSAHRKPAYDINKNKVSNRFGQPSSAELSCIQSVLNVSSLNNKYLNIQHIYSTTLQRKAYILTKWLFYTTSAVYKSYWFGFM